MSISKKDVQHIARLARIELTSAEEAKFEKDLSGVLDFIGKLNAVNTNDIKPVQGGIDLMSVMRCDETKKEELDVEYEARRAASLVKAVPDRKDGFVKVKGVFE